LSNSVIASEFGCPRMIFRVDFSYCTVSIFPGRVSLKSVHLSAARQ